MKIYTGTCAGEKFDKVKDNGLGIMISPSPTFDVRPIFTNTFCAFDNGAYQAWNRGYPFLERHFWDALERCYTLTIKLDFIVCPDIVAGGKKSLDFSVKWSERLLGTKLALPLQDEMIPADITPDIRKNFTHLFLGGTKKWKSQTLNGWVECSKSWKMPLHVGRIGTLPLLLRCRDAGVESVDSTNFSRNDSWGVIADYNSKSLFETLIARKGADNE
jgi:hypothetical protein